MCSSVYTTILGRKYLLHTSKLASMSSDSVFKLWRMWHFLQVVCMCVPEAGRLGRWIWGRGRHTAEGGPMDFWHHFSWVGVLFSGHYTRYTFKSALSHLKFSQRLVLGLLLVFSLDAIFVFHFFLVFIVILVGNWKSLYLRHLPRQQFILLTF